MRRFSLVDYDACYMGSYEVVASMRDVSDYLLASEHGEPWHGQDYAPLKMLQTQPKTTPETLGRAMLDAYFELAKREKDERMVTMSLVDLRKVEPLVDAMTGFASELASVRAASSGARGIRRCRSISAIRRRSTTRSISCRSRIAHRPSTRRCGRARSA